MARMCNYLTVWARRPRENGSTGWGVRLAETLRAGKPSTSSMSAARPGSREAISNTLSDAWQTSYIKKPDNVHQFSHRLQHSMLHVDKQTNCDKITTTFFDNSQVQRHIYPITQVDHSAVLTRQLWSSVFCCCGPNNLEFAAIQSSWPSSES